jgi:hypothetical protein
MDEPPQLPPQQQPLPPATMIAAASPPAETLSGHFLGISLRRAFRLHIRSEEVLPSERAVLESQARHVRDPDQQAFLAWRRSVLLMIAVMFVPLTIFRFFEAFDGPPLPTGGRIFVMLPAFGEGLFRNAFDSSLNIAQSAAEIGGIHLNVNRNTFRMVIGLAFGVQATLALGPKVISLMPGLIRASIVTKLLFPGTTAPGWLMMLAAPLYALFAYIIVLLPYQITGSWQFVAGNAGVLLAQVFIGISGRKLTVPLTTQESSDRIHKSWLAYIGILVVSAGFMVYGLADFVAELHLGKVRVVTSVMAVASNVLLDTLVGTDAIVAAMAHFRRRGPPDPMHEQLFRDAETKLETFAA